MVNDVWEVVSRPQDKSVVGSRWNYKIKYAADGSIEKYKARFVAKGYAQKEGIHYEETFAPVAKYTSIRIMISIATQMGWEIHQMDVKTTFLNKVIEEEVYIEQPEGFETHEKKSHVCRQKKALHGLKQAPRTWYGRIDGYLQKMGFVKSDVDPNLYYLIVKSEPLILVLYVDDLFLTGSSRLIEDCKKNLATEFDMKDLGRMQCFLGLELGSLAVERINLPWARKVCYRNSEKGKEIKLSGFTDADWAGSSVDRKSTFRYCFNIGSGITSWCNRKQKSVALSSSKVEYMAASTALCEAIWLRKLSVNLFRENMEATKIMCDNQSCIKLSENLVFHDRSKHIDIRYHFVRECVQRGAVQLSYTPTGEQVADILTKALGRSKFDYFREKMGMC
eukprot:PITA_13445